MNSEKESPIRMAYAGHRTRIVVRVLKGLLLSLLTLLSFIVAIPLHPGTATPSSGSSTDSNGISPPPGSQLPLTVGADPLPDLRLPRTVLSSVNDLIGAGGVIQTSPENLTLYNLAVTMRLLGGLLPHDELLGRDHSVLSPYMFWSVRASVGEAWIPLLPVSNNFTMMGTNSTGTFLRRTMQVSSGDLSGTLTIVYEATAKGPLKWELGFTPVSSGHYNLVYSWRNLTSSYQLSPSLKQLQVNYRAPNYRAANYTLSWADVSSSLNTTTSLLPNQYLLYIDLGTVAAGTAVKVDPSIVSSNVAGVATAYTFQRRVFYDPKGGYYFAFYYDGWAVGYSSWHNGTKWSPRQDMPNGWPAFSDAPSSLPAVYNLGQSVVVAAGQTSSGGCGSPCPVTISASLFFSIGNVSGSTIFWGSTKTAVPFSYPCSNSCLIGVRYVDATISSSGRVAFSFEEYLTTPTLYPPCSSTLYVTYDKRLLSADTDNACPPDSFSSGADNIRSAVVPSDQQGRVRVVYQIYKPTSSGWTKMLRSMWYDNSSQGTIETLDNNVYNTDEFSVVSDADYGVHIVYRGASDGNVTYTYRAVTDISWTYFRNLFSGVANYPTVTADYSTNDVYAFGVKGSSIAMRVRVSGQSWIDGSMSFPVTRRNNATFLGSNFASASANVNSTNIALLWTEGPGPGPYSVTFASIPIQTVWSPYSSPSDPWDGSGLAPFGQYFANLGEYVSPSTGMLTVRQTDLAISGRGLNLEITRVYTEPYSFLNGTYNFERYPWAPLGNGWQLNFPWMNNVSSPSNPAYIHLWDGEGYRIPSSFWTNNPVWENHAGEHFRLLKNSTGIFLYAKSGVSYIFDSRQRLNKIQDPLGNNITLSYDSANHISSITDTVQRTFLFCYTSGLLSSIEQNSSRCGQPVPDFARRVVYSYSGQNLASATDPGGRITSYAYGSPFSPTVQYWLLTRLTYPTGWYSNYTFSQLSVGTQAYTYPVTKQYLGSGSAPVREFLYAYTQGAGDRVTNSTVTTLDGASGSLQTVSYTSYSFSFTGIFWNVSDANHRFARGVQQRFGVHGEVPREIVLVSPTLGYTNSYRYDLWGNLIYTRRVINPSAGWYHESFSTYYNSGLQPRFSAFQETFSQSQGTSTDNPWNVQSGYWMVKNGAYNGTETSSPQEGTFAWANNSLADISLQARVYVSKPVNSSDQRVGIFVHYPGTGFYKWALVLHNRTNSGGTYIELLDEQRIWLGTNSTQPGAAASCLIQRGAWYTFNMTIHGYQAWGSVHRDGSSPCPTVTGLFNTSSPAVHGTGFGLYAGGYSALFDNVTVATVSPRITTTNFSNSFITGGTPGPNIHGALAGTAELQNGTGTVPIETYYSYYPWGGLNQTRQRYDPQPGFTGWIATSKTYDRYGNLVTLTDARGNATSYAYSSKYQYAYLTNATAVLNPGSTQITKLYSYNFTFGTMRSTVDANGSNTTYQYDILERLKKVTYPTGDYVSYNYNDTWNFVEITNENGFRTRQIYDGLGRASVVERFLGSKPYSNDTTSYNWQDRVISRTDPLGNVTRYQYDVLGRLTNTAKPDGTTVQRIYDDSSSNVKVIDEGNNFRLYVYDRLGRLIQVGEQSCNLCLTYTSYSYDEVGNFLQVKSSNAQTTGYAYDNLNRLTQTSYPDGSTETYAYDTSGNVVVKREKNVFFRTVYSYDSQSRVTKIAYQVYVGFFGWATSTADNYTYDRNSNLLSLQSINATLTYTYDSRNRITGEAYSINGGQVGGPLGSGSSGSGSCKLRCPNQPLSTATSTSSGIAFAGYSYKYMYNGELQSQITYTDFLSVGYKYDGLGRVSNLTQSGTGSTTYLASSIIYDRNDQVRKISYGNGLTATYTYDKVGRPATISLGAILSLTYSYNTTGTVASVIGQVNGVNVSEQYRYDPLQRLTNATLTTGKTPPTILWYEYDSMGNRIWQSVNGALTNYTYNLSNNELTKTYALNGGSSNTYSYDINGNLGAMNVATATGTTHWTYTWDQPGRFLMKASNDAGTQGVYAYDGLGRKVEALEGASTVFYAYRGTETLMEQVPSGAATDYVYAAGLRIAKSGVYTATYYYHTDALGSTRLVTDSNAKVVFSDNYQPFGQDNGTPTGSETNRFTGKPVSATTGLYYYYSRWYDPSTGRFISQDPLAGSLADPQSLNPYVYVENLPTLLVDPTGAVGASDCTYALCQGPPVSIDIQNITDPYLQELCVEDPYLCESILRYYGYEPIGGGVPDTGDAGVPGWTVSTGSGEPTPIAPTVSGGDLPNIQVDTNPTTTATTTVTQPLMSDVVPTSEFFSSVENPVEFNACSTCWRGYQYGSYAGYSTRYATPTLYSSPGEARAALKLPYYNTADYVREVEIPRGVPFRIDSVAGGTGIEVQVTDPSVFIGGLWRQLVRIVAI